MATEKIFTLFWNDGHSEVVRGPNLRVAMLMRGYSRYSQGALFPVEGEPTNYIFDYQDKTWRLREDEIETNTQQENHEDKGKESKDESSSVARREAAADRDLGTDDGAAS